MACARSSAHRSATSATAMMTDGSRRGSVQTVQGFCVSMLPHKRQIWILSMAVCKAVVSGAISSSRFLMRWSATRRAERGPNPGNRAKSWIRRSISGPATAEGIKGPYSIAARMRSKQLHTRRQLQRQAASQALHFLLNQDFGFATCVGVSSDNEVLDDLSFLGLHQGGIDAHALGLALGRELDRDEAATGAALDLDVLEFGLQGFHFRFDFRGLFHQAHKVRHVITFSNTRIGY